MRPLFTWPLFTIQALAPSAYYDAPMPGNAPHKLTEVLAERDEIAVAYLFGSTARGDSSHLSDIDVGVLLANGPGNLLRYRARLSEDLSRAMEGTPVEVVLLADAPPALAAKAIREGRLLLCRDDATRVRFEFHTLRRDFDTAPLRRMYDQTLAAAIREGRFFG